MHLTHEQGISYLLTVFLALLAAPVAAGASEAMVWWACNSSAYRNTARITRQYLSVPATSAQSERQFSATGRLISKLHSRLDPDRVDKLIFLYKNM